MPHNMKQVFAADVFGKLLFEGLWKMVEWAAGTAAAGGGAFIAVRNLAAMVGPLAAQQRNFAMLGMAVAVWRFVAWKRAHDRFIPQFDKVDADFHILDKEVSFTYHSATRMQVERIWKVRANKNGLRSFMDNFRWSGSAPASLRSAKVEHQIVMGLRKGFFQYYTVEFGRELKKGDVEEICVVLELEDPELRHVPCLSTRITEPTDSLTMTLQFPETLHIGEIIAEILPAQGFNAKEAPERLQAVNYRVRWKPPQPARLMHYYELRWDLPQHHPDDSVRSSK